MTIMRRMVCAVLLDLLGDQIRLGGRVHSVSRWTTKPADLLEIHRGLSNVFHEGRTACWTKAAAGRGENGSQGWK